mmetsp:Transcript_24536/g.27962  ORF Transcript_24536/g.27962 Transcript_24536/m.27962 type:complete len:84 (-) Transcript_24536:28-279(-)
MVRRWNRFGIKESILKDDDDDDIGTILPEKAEVDTANDKNAAIIVNNVPILERTIIRESNKTSFLLLSVVVVESNNDRRNEDN